MIQIFRNTAFAMVAGPVSFVLLFAGCTTWAPATHPAPDVTVFPPNERVCIWTNGSGFDLHRIEVSDSVLTGMPHWQSLLSEENRVTISLPAIDSMQRRRGSALRTSLLLGSVPAVWWIAVYVALQGGH